ncbi:hypothetical protein [Bacteriovorax sp. Seq25_V]|uniref:hypothetical protein n=1 Tax=Bacteriovorax sp. Seq25_V TaxID=1201288 RepID=UPI000389DE68|nr:hypothetical protein [Bacteriovorax sp. Seq25_V]EQC45582.1 hypothetical protein M900_2088 [Bacteriovorax sp. Seq25_V]
MKNIFLMLCTSLVLVFSPVANAQDSSTFADESLRDISIVAGLGAGGAVMGLSTLSFVEEPSDHLKNIVVGAAIGIIIGVGVVAYSQASKSKEYIEGAQIKDFSTKDRVKWHAANSFTAKSKSFSNQPQVGYTFSF